MDTLLQILRENANQGDKDFMEEFVKSKMASDFIDENFVSKE